MWVNQGLQSPKLFARIHYDKEHDHYGNAQLCKK